MRVFVDDFEEFFDRRCFRVRLVTVPFLISTLPKHLPTSLALVVGRFRDGTFQRFTLVAPMGSDVIYLHALTGDTECKVNLGPEMRRRPPLLDEFVDQLLTALYFKFRNCHGHWHRMPSSL